MLPSSESLVWGMLLSTHIPIVLVNLTLEFREEKKTSLADGKEAIATNTVTIALLIR